MGGVVDGVLEGGRVVGFAVTLGAEGARAVEFGFGEVGVLRLGALVVLVAAEERCWAGGGCEGALKVGGPLGGVGVALTPGGDGGGAGGACEGDGGAGTVDDGGDVLDLDLRGCKSGVSQWRE